MKAFAFIGLIIFGMVATEGVFVEEYDGGQDVFEVACDEATVGSPSDIVGDEVLACLDESEETVGGCEPFVVR